MKRKIINYDDRESGNTETHIATDNYMDEHSGHYQNALVEGFASADGIRGITAASGGRIKHPEKSDAAVVPGRVLTNIQDENPGLADD